MRTRLLWMGLLSMALFGFLPIDSGAGQQKPTTRRLVPRQTYRVNPQERSGTQNQHPSVPWIRDRDIAVTPRVLTVVLHDSLSMAAFDRNTGKELWRKERSVEMGAIGLGGNAPARNDRQPTGRGPVQRNLPGTVRATLSAQTRKVSAVWKLIGAVSRQSGDGVVVLLSWYPAQSGASQQSAPQAELQGAEASTGHELWKVAWDGARPEEWPSPVGIYGSLVALLPADPSRHATNSQEERRENISQANFIDAFTGRRLPSSSTPEGRSALKHAADLHGSAFDLTFSDVDRPRLLHLETGKAQSLPMQSGYSQLVGRTAARGVILVNMDDDYAGHSVWPHYVYGVDGMGKTAWQFPKHILLPGVNFDLATGRGFDGDKDLLGHDFEDVSEAQAVAAAHTVLVTTSTPYQTQQSNLYGLRDTDGRVLWHKPANGIHSLRAYKQGCFALTEAGQLTYIDAQTGQRRSCGQLPGSVNLLVAGGDLLAVHIDGTITAYDIARLLKPVSVSKSHATPTDH